MSKFKNREAREKKYDSYKKKVCNWTRKLLEEISWRPEVFLLVFTSLNFYDGVIIGALGKICSLQPINILLRSSGLSRIKQ